MNMTSRSRSTSSQNTITLEENSCRNETNLVTHVTQKSHRPMARPTKHKPTLQPAGLLSTTESHKLIRDRLKQELPKTRRLVIKDRIELFLPTDFSDIRQNSDINSPLDNENFGAPDNYLYQQMQVNSGSLKLEVPLNVAESNVVRNPSFLLPSPRSMLGAGRVDPFANYPIPVTIREQWLLDRVNSAADPNSITFRDTWLPTATKDATSFYQFLANVSLDMHWANGRELDNPVSVGYHTLALKAINNKLSNPRSSTSETVVYSITGFMCYNVYCEDFAGFETHINGLAKIIQLRGGFETLNENPSLRCMVFGVDLSAACLRDTRPRFQFPTHIGSRFRSDILEKLNHQLQNQKKIPQPWWLLDFQDDQLLNTAFHDTRIAIDFTKYKEARGERWKNVKFLTYWIDPILHTLVGKSIPATDARSVMQEATRLGLILFLCKLRQISGQLGIETKLFVAKLKTLLLYGGLDVYLKSLEPMLVWIVVFGMVESWNMDERTWYIEMIANLALEMNLASWGAVVGLAKEVLWIDRVFDSELEKCREQFDGQLLFMSY